MIRIVLGALVLASAGPAAAQEGAGGTQSIFGIGAGSRAIALGGAFAAIGDDPSVLAYNPAGLRANRWPAALLNHTPLFSGFSDASYDFAGLVYPTLSAGSIGLAFMTVGTGDIRGFDESSRETGDLSYRESQAILGYAFDIPWRFFGRFVAGSSVKVLHQRVGEFSDTGAGLDCGLLYLPQRPGGVVLGLSVRDLVGAETKLVASTEKVDRTITAGIGYGRAVGSGSALAFALQADLPQRDDMKIRAGAEYVVKNLMSFRIGFDGDAVTAGVGIAWRGFEVGYGYFSRDEAGSSHPVSVSSRIGRSIDERIASRERARQAEEERRIQQTFARRIGAHIDSAARYRAEGNPEAAVDELKIAIEYDPTNAAAAETLRVVEREIIRAQEERSRTAEKAAITNRHFALGVEYYSASDYLRAAAEWRAVLAIDSTNSPAREYLVRTEEKLREQVTQHAARARELEAGGSLGAALGEWNIVRTLDPASTEAIEASTRIDRRLAEMSASYGETNRRLRILELFDGAMRFFQEGEYGESVKSLNELLRIQPGHEEARRLLLRAQRRLQPLTDAEKAEVRAIYIEGMKAFTQNDYAKAIEVWRRILEIDPDNESVARNIEEAEKRLKSASAPEGER